MEKKEPPQDQNQDQRPGKISKESGREIQGRPCPTCGALPRRPDRDLSFIKDKKISAAFTKLAENLYLYSCSCLKLKELQQIAQLDWLRRLQASQIPLRYHGAMLRLSGKSAYEQEIIPICWLYLNGLISRSGKQGLLLMGNVGVGKTYFMCAMLIELLKNKKQCLFINMPEFYHQLKSNFTDEGTPEYSRLISQAKEIEILAIDELAQKKLSSWAQEELYGIINYRYNQQLPLMATTSSTDEKLKSYISADIIDRLYEICLAYKISGPSLRPGRKF